MVTVATGKKNLYSKYLSQLLLAVGEGKGEKKKDEVNFSNTNAFFQSANTHFFFNVGINILKVRPAMIVPT